MATPPAPPAAGTATASVDVVDAPSAEQVGEVEGLLARARAADGTEVASEDARLALRRAAAGRPARPAARPARHLLLRAADGALAGYAQLPPPGAHAAELVVDPAARGRGLGGQLVAALERAADERPEDGAEDGTGGGASGAPLRVWSHTGSPAAAALAARRGWRAVRHLERHGRDLGGGHPLPPLEVPDDVQVRAFEPGRDEAAWLAVNARAFADHPEQGRWGPEDLAARQGEPWFDPAGLLLAVDGQDGSLLASHWTKVDPGSGDGDGGAPRGEVYVVAVDPSAQGRGIGSAVTLAGLHHLDLSGVARVQLYVEAGNAAAQRLYGHLGFVREAVEVLWERSAPAGRREGGPPTG